MTDDKKLTDYKPLSRNPNKGTQRGSGIIQQSVQQLGAGRSILVDKNNVILAGNHAQEAFINSGIDDVIEVETTGNQVVVVKRTDLDATETTGKKMAIMDNRSSEVGLEWDRIELEALMLEIKADEGELDMTLSSLADDLKIEFDEPPEDVEPQIDNAEELRIKWGVELGQLWELGEHRLICGDCTNKAVVDRLMGGEKAVCMWTDPPYGVSYVGKTADALTIENDGSEGLEKLLTDCYAIANEFLEDGSPIYTAHPAGALQMIFNKTFVSTGWKFHETLIWVKNSMVMGHSDYHYKHEPIMYGWKGKNRNWYAGRDQVSVFEIDRPQRSELHPTMKPVQLIVAHTGNSTKKGDILYEPFNGSGSTLIACEQTHRRCYALELDPKYVAVAIQRWVDVTGKEPKLMTE